MWYGTREATPLLYNPVEPVAELRPRNATNRRLVSGPTLEADHLVFARLTLAWSQWLAVWNIRDHDEPPRFGSIEWDLTLLPPH